MIPGESRPRVPFRYRAPVIAALLVLAVTACSVVAGYQLSRPTMTSKHATDRAEQILRDTVSAVTPRPRLEPVRPGLIIDQCVADNDPRDTRVQVSLSYWLRGITPADNASVSKQILRYWKHQGYTIYYAKVGNSAPDISGATPSDDFLISLDWSDDGSLSIGTSSPCIWSNGTPPPGV